MSRYFHASTLLVFKDRSGDLDPPAFPASRKLTAQGKYKYNTKSKASWYWSRSYGASSRLGCQYYVLTDWQRWAFGVFDESREHGYVSPVWEFGAKEPSVMQALFYWARYVALYVPFIGSGRRIWKANNTIGLAWRGNELQQSKGSSNLLGAAGTLRTRGATADNTGRPSETRMASRSPLPTLRAGPRPIFSPTTRLGGSA